MIEAGTVLQNRYRVQEKVGQGGMGTVYIATDERFGSVVAIKETTFDDPDLRKAFEREAHLLNGLRHPALPRVSDHFTEDNGQFLVMEYIAGEDLSELLTRVGVFPVADVLTWTGQLLDALEYLHSQRVPVIHRDIKPQNLKLTERGEVILLDFGLAKGNPTDVSRVSLAQSVLGYSRSYASLEQMQGTGTDPRSDLYSLAATAYHLITGKTPIDSLTRATSILNGQPDPLVPANTLRPEIPAAFTQLLAQALSLNSSLRPTTATEMRQALTQIEALPTIESNAAVEPSLITIKSVGAAESAANNLLTFAKVNEKPNTTVENKQVAATGLVTNNEPDTRVQKSDSTPNRAVTNPRRRMSRRGSVSTPISVPAQISSVKPESSIGKFLGAAAAVVVLGGGLTWYAMSGSNASTNTNTARTTNAAQGQSAGARENNSRAAETASGGSNSAATSITAAAPATDNSKILNESGSPTTAVSTTVGTAANRRGEQPPREREERRQPITAPAEVAVPNKDEERGNDEQPRRQKPAAREITEETPVEEESSGENDESLEADRAEREERLRRNEQRREQRQAERERRRENRQKQGEVQVEKEAPPSDPFR